MKVMTTLEAWDWLDKRVDAYAERHNISDVKVEELLRDLIRKRDVNMYQAMSILEKEEPGMTKSC